MFKKRQLCSNNSNIFTNIHYISSMIYAITTYKQSYIFKA